MLNRSEILRAAWASYRREYAGRPFHRNGFRMALRAAWFDAKTMAWVLRLQADEAAERATVAPEVTAAKDELVSLNMKDFWTAADSARYSARSAVTSHTMRVAA